MHAIANCNRPASYGVFAEHANEIQSSNELSGSDRLLLSRTVYQLPHALITILFQHVCDTDVAAVNDPAGLHHMHEVRLYEIEEPLVMSDHDGGAVRRFQTIHSLRHVSERINVQPCVASVSSVNVSGSPDSEAM